MNQARLPAVARRGFGLFLAAAWIVTLALAKFGKFLVRSKSLIVYGLLFIATIFVPPLGLLLVGCMFIWLTRPLWNRRRFRTERIP